MIRSTLATLAGLGMVVACTGCQNSGRSEPRADVDRPRVVADADTYTRAYTVNNDTGYMQTPSETTASGTLKRGEVVYLRDSAPASGTVQVRTADGRTVWVRANDLTLRTNP